MNADSIRQTNISAPLYGTTAPAAKSAGKPAEQSQAETGLSITDGFTKSDDLSLDDQGNVRFILSFDDAKSASSLRDSWAQQDSGVKVADQFPLVNGFAVEVKPDNINGLLTSLPIGSKVAIDRPVTFNAPNISAGDPALKSGASRAGKDALADVANSLIGIDKVWDQGFTGQGQTIAVIDSGIYPHPDLKDKIVAWVDVNSGKTQPFDDFGHGTHVAGIAAGSGIKSAGAHKGVAPDANVVGVRITNVSEAIKGIQWVIENREKYNIGVINMSLGDFACRSYKDDPWAQAAEKAMEAGLVVCVAAGNDGPSEQNISTPGIHPDVITVGALDDKGTLDRKDDTIAEFSSRGPTNVDGINKPDLVAPGVNVIGPLSPNGSMNTPELPHIGNDYVAISGTSMATPMVAGLSACLLQANPGLSHKDIKEILVQSCDNYVDEPKNVQGAGLINAEKALKLAMEWNKSASVAESSSAVVTNGENAPTSHQQYDESAGFLMA